MLRYLRLYGSFLKFSFGRAMQFRLDFFFRVFMDMLWYAQYLAFFGLLLSQSPTVGGWDVDDMRLFAATLFVVDAMQMTLFSNNLWALIHVVNKGDLDYHLVRPVSTLFFVSLRDFAVNSFLNLLMALGILVWAFSKYPRPLPFPTVALYGILLLVSLGIHYCVQMMSLLPIFWMQSGRGLRDVFFSLDSYTARPVGVFTGWVHRILLTVLPLGIVVSFPVRILVEGPNPSIVLHMLAVLVGGFSVLLFVWRRGLKAYASASS